MISEDALQKNIFVSEVICFCSRLFLILNDVFDAEKLISHVIKPGQIMEAYHGLMYKKEDWHCVVIDWKEAD